MTPTDRAQGLSSDEAQRRLLRFGANRLVPRAGWRRWLPLLGPLLDPMTLMLLACAALYGLLGERRDAMIMLVAVFPVVAVDVMLEARNRRAMRALARAVAPRATVIRDGREQDLAAELLVPGDLVVLREGDVLQADGVLVETANLTIDESSLTGEAEPIAKRPLGPQESSTPPAPDTQFFAGSTLRTGHGLGELRATGQATRFGHVARLVDDTADVVTPIQKRTARLVRRLAVVATATALVVLVAAMVRGESLAHGLLSAVSLMMATLPEEFPFVYALFLSVGAVRLGARGVLVRRLACVETLGSTTVICTDKTGTLTRGEFKLDVLAPVAGRTEDELLRAAILACELEPRDLMERAIEEGAHTRGMDPAAVRSSLKLRRDYDFDPDGKHMSHLWTASDGSEQLVAKGAFEGIAQHCALPPAERQAAEQQLAVLAGKGFRLLAVARRHDSTPLRGERAEDERDLTLLGFIGFGDPVRPEVLPAVALCQQAGITIKIITGDHALTAHAVADATGIIHRHDGHDHPIVVTGPELAALSPKGKLRCVREAAIFARFDPTQKHELVRLLKEAGHVVAMIGDGVNDAPALRLADIGITMGLRGTGVARGAADLVLMRDDFSAIAETVRAGRELFENIQQAFLYLIGFHIPITVVSMAAPLLGVPLVFFPVHLVWLQLIVHPISAIAFQGGQPSAGLMDEKPRAPQTGLLPRRGIIVSAISGATLALAVLGAYGYALPGGEDRARTFALAALFAGYQLLAWMERSSRAGRWAKRGRMGVVFWTAWLASGATFPVVLAIPALRELTHLTPLPALAFLYATGLAAAALGWRFFLPTRPAATALR